jgi:CelD/BcsL family acetyltransferase involved in cellulose biosynthesis
MTAIDPFLAAAIAAKGVPLSADWAPQPAAKPRWQQLRADLINTFSPYMPATAATKATDALDRLIVELGAPGLTARGGAEAGR